VGGGGPLPQIFRYTGRGCYKRIGMWGGGWGGGGVCFHIYLDILGCAAMKGIVFKQFSLGEDIETRE